MLGVGAAPRLRLYDAVARCNNLHKSRRRGVQATLAVPPHMQCVLRCNHKSHVTRDTSYHQAQHQQTCATVSFQSSRAPAHNCSTVSLPRPPPPSITTPLQHCVQTSTKNPNPNPQPPTSNLQGQKPSGTPQLLLPVPTPRQRPGHHCTGRFPALLTPSCMRLAVYTYASSGSSNPCCRCHAPIVGFCASLQQPTSTSSCPVCSSSSGSSCASSATTS